MEYKRLRTSDRVPTGSLISSSIQHFYTMPYHILCRRTPTIPIRYLRHQFQPYIYRSIQCTTRTPPCTSEPLTTGWFYNVSSIQSSKLMLKGIPTMQSIQLF